MKTILFLLLCSFSMNFSGKDKLDPKILGTIQLVQTSDKQVVLYYNGEINYCHMKYAIDILLSECDTSLQEKCNFEMIFPGLHIISFDQLEIEQIDSTKNIKRI